LELSFVRGLDLSGTPQGAGGVGGLLFVGHFASAIGYHAVACDGNGNVAALVDAADGTESARYEYGPFGEPLRVTGPMGKVNPLRFSTQYADDWTGDLKYLYRDYRPDLGRWPSRDPLMADEAFSPDGLGLRPEVLMGAMANESPNLYGFVRQSPMNSVDHLGLLSIPDAADWALNHSLCLASTLGIGKCCAERFTAALPVQKYDAGVVGLEFKFEWRTQVQKCRQCCGDRITISSDLRGTMDLKVQLGVIPTPVPIVVRAYGGGSIGGALVTRIDTCTGLNKTSGCTFVTGRFGAEGCATLGVGEVCLRAEGNYTHRNCRDPDLSTDCLAGRAMLRFKVLWRSYDFVFWQTAPCATN
jgi:RHS repeat-associated protein